MWPFDNEKKIDDQSDKNNFPRPGKPIRIQPVDAIQVEITGIPMISAEPGPIRKYAQRLIDQAYPDWSERRVGRVSLHIAIDDDGNEKATWEAECDVMRPCGKLEEKQTEKTP